MSLLGWIGNLFGIPGNKELVKEELVGINDDDELLKEKSDDEERQPAEDHTEVFAGPKQKMDYAFDMKALVQAYLFIRETYGGKIFENAVVIKNMMADLIPFLPRERKLFLILCRLKGIDSLEALKYENKAEIQLWIEKYVNYFVDYELIDRDIAYCFLDSLSTEFPTSVWIKEKTGDSELINQDFGTHNRDRQYFEFEIESSKKGFLLSEGYKDNKDNTEFEDENEIKETIEDTSNYNCSIETVNQTECFDDHQRAVVEDRAQLIGRLVTSIRTPLNDLVNVLYGIAQIYSASEENSNYIKDIEAEKHLQNTATEYDVYYQRSRSITDKFEGPNYEMLYQFWNAYCKCPDFQKYIEALCVILKERNIPFSEEAINEHFQILEGKPINISVSPEGNNSKLIDTATSSKSLDHKGLIGNEHVRISDGHRESNDNCNGFEEKNDVEETLTDTSSNVRLIETVNHIDFPDWQNTTIEQDIYYQRSRSITDNIDFPDWQNTAIEQDVYYQRSRSITDNIDFPDWQNTTIEQDVYYQRSRSITDKFETPSYEMLYRFWNTFCKCPDFEKYKEALYLILKERKIPFSEEAINEQFQILEGKPINIPVSPKGNNGKLFDTSTSSKSLERKSFIGNEDIQISEGNRESNDNCNGFEEKSEIEETLTDTSSNVQLVETGNHIDYPDRQNTTIEQDVYYQRSRSITDKYETSSYEMLYHFWDTFCKCPDFVKYKEALYLILRERQIPFSEEAINEHFQILEGKLFDVPFSSISKNGKTIDMSVSPKCIDINSLIAKEKIRKHLSSISRADAVIYPQKIINEIVEKHIDSSYDMLYVFWTIYKNSYRFDYFTEILFEILRDRNIPFSKEVVRKYFNIFLGIHSYDLTDKEKNSTQYKPAIKDYSSTSSFTSQFDIKHDRTTTYKSTGRVEFVRGHWRKRNGQWEYVHEHIRHK